MHGLLRSKRLGVWVAGAIGFYGFCLGCRRLTVANASTNPTSGQLPIASLDSVLDVIAFGLVGLLAGLILTAIQEALHALDRAHEWRSGEPERWEQLLSQFEARAPLGRDGASERSAGPGHQETVDAIRRAIQSQEWSEAAQVLDQFKVDEPSHSEIERLSQAIESGRRATVENRLELIQVSREVNDSERLLELYQEVAPLLDASARKSLEEDLARWFMSAIQKRLRSGTIQAEVVILSARVSEIFSGTIEGASLRAGLPTLRRTVGLCPRCAGPYIGVAQACPTCLGTATS